ncbi:MAG: hypothetical protein JWM11_3635 [Planctomycetaceae bacterium]|nr:hypothetical protein [Planctomycetaceae bacterium]
MLISPTPKVLQFMCQSRSGNGLSGLSRDSLAFDLHWECVWTWQTRLRRHSTLSRFSFLLLPISECPIREIAGFRGCSIMRIHSERGRREPMLVEFRSRTEPKIIRKSQPNFETRLPNSSFQWCSTVTSASPLRCRTGNKIREICLPEFCAPRWSTGLSVPCQFSGADCNGAIIAFSY